MKSIRCSKGHFYDGDRYASCPHCQDGGEPNNTVAFKQSDEDQGTTIVKGSDSESEYDPPIIQNDDDAKTISILNYDQVEGTPKPTVGWLVCVKGRFEGKDFCLKSGSNFIGRDGDMDVCLAGEASVSRKRHAIIIYEPRQNLFMVRPGYSRELFYLKYEVVLEPKKIEKNDIIQVGTVSLMLVPCCDDKFTWPLPE